MLRSTAPLILQLPVTTAGTPQPVRAKPDGTPGTEYPVGYVSFRCPATNTGAYVKVGRIDQTGTYQFFRVEKSPLPYVLALQRDVLGNIDLSSIYVDALTSGDIVEIVAFNYRQ